MNSKLKEQQLIETDILIIGSRAAIEAGRYGADVTVLDKLVIGFNNNSTFAGGGFKAALPGIMEADAVSQYNTPREHFVDTVEYCAYVNNQRLVEALALDSPAQSKSPLGITKAGPSLRAVSPPGRKLDPDLYLNDSPTKEVRCNRFP